MIPHQAVVPILQGRLKGSKWIVGSGIHGYWLGSYEIHMQKAFEGVISTNSIVFDIGAHVGYYTLLSSTLVGPGGKVYAFEPLPRNIAFIKRHILMNLVTNVDVVEAAVSEKTGSTFFVEGEESPMGQISSEGYLQVKTVSLDELVSTGKVEFPDYMKIDVEGAEYDVLLGARRIIREKLPKIFLATHGQELKEKCCQMLLDWGYSIEPIDSTNLLDARELLAIPGA